MHKVFRLSNYLSVINKIKDNQKVKELKPKFHTNSYDYRDFKGSTTYQQQKNNLNLTPGQIRITQTKSMQRPYTGNLWDQKSPGFYHCAVCKTRLFSFNHKFTSKIGYASFWGSIKGRINRDQQEVKFETTNLQVKQWNFQEKQYERCSCSICNAHLGVVFFDGPPPTFLHYAINSSMLKFYLLQDFQDPKNERIKRINYWQSQKRAPLPPIPKLKI